VRLEIKPGGHDRAQNADGGEEQRRQKVGVKPLGLPEAVGAEGQMGKPQRHTNECQLGAREGDEHRREYDGPCRREGGAPGNGEKKANTTANAAARNSTAPIAASNQRRAGTGQELETGGADFRHHKGDRDCFHCTLIGLSRQAFKQSNRP
jgi:hypothetical protein